MKRQAVVLAEHRRYHDKLRQIRACAFGGRREYPATQEELRYRLLHIEELCDSALNEKKPEPTP